MSWLFGKSEAGEGAKDEAAAAAAGEASPSVEVKPEQLDKDEIRRRRLANFSSAQSDAKSDATSDRASTPEKPLAKRERLDTSESPAPIAAAAFKLNTPSKPAPPPAASSAPVPPPLAAQQSPARATPMKSPARSSGRALTFALEQIFQFSLRADCEPPIQFLDIGIVDDNGGNFDSSRVSELVCMHIAGMESGSGVLYLAACHRRLCQKEQTAAETQKAELANCRKQIICFIVSCLSDPDIFGPESANSIPDFVRHIGSDFNPSFGVSMLRGLADELDAQGCLDSVVKSLLLACYVDLNGQPQAQQPAMMQFDARGLSPVSVLDDVSAPVSALVTLITADKRFGKAFCAHTNFLVAADKQTPLAANVFNRMMHPRAFIEGGGAAGTAVEHHTVLGRMLRSGSPDPRDPKVVDLLKDSAKQPRGVVDGNVARIRSKSATVQGQAADVLTALLKDKQSKEIALGWMRQCVGLNLEATKEQPNAQYASSRGFLINYAGAMLRLCRPFMGDVEKIKKVDWRLLISSDYTDVFPTDETPITTAMTESAFPASLSRRLPKVPEQKDFNFLTVSLFLAWRGIHLGLANECVHYGRIMRGIHHFHDELATGHPQATAYLVNKFVLDALMLSPDFIQDALSFCSTACIFLKLNFCSPDVGDHWQVAFDLNCPADIEQYGLLAAMPQHLLEDICDIFLFVAKTNGSFFKGIDLSPVLSVFIYFLRRPWAAGSPHLRAKLGQVLFYVFLPASERKNVEHYTVSVEYTLYNIFEKIN
jgi:hypothetical protein